MQTPRERDLYQSDVVIAASHGQLKLRYLVRRAIDLGPSGCLERLASRYRTFELTAHVFAPETGHAHICEALGLQPGDEVEVRSEDEIRRTLDASGRSKGLLFMPEMRRYCGQKMVVYKRLNNILMETTGHMRRMKNTVLLQEAIYFWREAWLKKV
jgi:hypothetical protein